MITPPPTDEVARRHALHAPFGSDAFGRKAEAFARFFGTATFLIAQTLVVAGLDRAQRDRRPATSTSTRSSC